MQLSNCVLDAHRAASQSSCWARTGAAGMANSTAVRNARTNLIVDLRSKFHRSVPARREKSQAKKDVRASLNNRGFACQSKLDAGACRRGGWTCKSYRPMTQQKATNIVCHPGAVTPTDSEHL